MRSTGPGSKKTFTRWRGLDWDPVIPEHQRHLILWKHYQEPYFASATLLNPVSEHVLEAGRIMFMPTQLVINPWFEKQAYSWTYDTFAIWWGSAGSGKSLSLGFLALLDYMTDPDCTFTLMASTSKEMLAQRSFAFVLQFLNYLKENNKFHVPFKSLASPMSVVPDLGPGEGSIASTQCKILGVAVQQGTVQEAKQNLQGTHTRYVRLILDELSGMRPAAMEARHNLSQCYDFKVIGACNPESIYDQAGIYSTPKDPSGWASVNENTDEWESKYGKVYRFDGFKSPGLAEPGLYPFLPTQVKIDREIAQNGGNADAPAVWTYIRGFPPPQGAERTVMTEFTVKTYGLLEPTTWDVGSLTKLAAFDPAYSSDGNNPSVVIAVVGYDVRKILTIHIIKCVNLVIRASSDKPVLEQLTEQFIDILDTEGIPQKHVGIDDSGLQSVADAVEMARGRGVFRFVSEARAPDIPISFSSEIKACEKYGNMTTWAWFLVEEYGRNGQIRGLPPAAAKQFCLRRVLPKQRPIKVEKKIDLKKRLQGDSPDEADACAILASMVRLRLGILPGATAWTSGGQDAMAPVEGSVYSPASVARFNNLETSYISDLTSEPRNEYSV